MPFAFSCKWRFFTARSCSAVFEIWLLISSGGSGQFYSTGKERERERVCAYEMKVKRLVSYIWGIALLPPPRMAVEELWPPILRFLSVLAQQWAAGGAPQAPASEWHHPPCEATGQPLQCAAFLPVLHVVVSVPFGFACFPSFAFAMPHASEAQIKGILHK